MVEYRKLISFGKTSYVVSIPKSWVVKNKLEKGDVLSFDEHNNNLVLSPGKGSEKHELKEISINVDGKSIRRLYREINSAYLNNHSVITLHGESIKEKAKDIRDSLQNLMAMEIIEQTSNKIIAKDFIDISTISIKEILRKVDIISREMLIDAKKSFEENNFESINHRDDDVNRLSFLIFRAVKSALNEPRLANQYKMNTEQLIYFWALTDHIEKIADHIKESSKNLELIKLNSKQQKELNEMFSDIENLYTEMLKAHYKDDVEKAFMLSNNKGGLFGKIDSFYAKNWKQKYVPEIVFNFKEMIDLIHDMGRLIYNKYNTTTNN